ncbi:unnamed protein product, partial [Heterotrigona itama]
MGRVDGATVISDVGSAGTRRKPCPTCYVTVAHIRPLGNCGTTPLSRGLPRPPGSGGGGVRTNQCVPGVDGDLAALRPDLVITHEPSRIVVIIDVTLAFENKFAAIEKARLEKVQKYQPLADALARSGHVVHVDGFVVGALERIKIIDRNRQENS